MSFNLSVSGHIDGDEQAAQVDELLKTKGAEIVAELGDLGVVPESASFSGPTGYANFLDAPIDGAGTDDSPGGT